MEDKNLPIVEYYKSELDEKKKEVYDLDCALLYLCYQTKRLMSEVATMTKHEKTNKKLYIDVLNDYFTTWIMMLQSMTIDLDKKELSLHAFLRDQKKLYDKRNGDFDLPRHRCLVCECKAYKLEIPKNAKGKPVPHSGQDERCPGNEDTETIPDIDRCHCDECSQRHTNNHHSSWENNKKNHTCR